MENKYYTPSIEEFHVGFEYYMPLLKEDEDGNLYQDDYVKHIWHESDNMWEYFNASFDGNNKKTITVPNVLKVKYLDREDIESLGFEYEGGQMMKGGREDYVRKGLILIYWPLIHKVELKYKNTIRDGSGDWDGYIMFFRKGEVKNKSELKRLLKQLGI